MSEYQYYEFQAVDRPLGDADRKMLRALSSRGQITATSFANSYEWGDFKGDPEKLMERCFDLHLYMANWGSRRLMMRLPGRLVDQARVEGVLRDVDGVDLKVSGEDLILDMRQDIEGEDDWVEGPGVLAGLAPLRADVLAGDFRLFYLLWLRAVEDESVEADGTEPLPGLGPLTGALEAFAEFFRIDPDLVVAAAERSAGTMVAPSAVDARRIVAALRDHDRTELLVRLVEGDPHVAIALRTLVRDRLASESSAPPLAPRTVAELRAGAQAIRLARERAEAAKAAAKRKRQEEEEARSRRARVSAVAQRGESVWRDIEAAIERRNASGYEEAVGLLRDLQTLAGQRGTAADFADRLLAIRERHFAKRRFIERLGTLG